MGKWDADRAVELWWKDKTPRIYHGDSSIRVRKKDTVCSSDRDAEPNFIDFSDWETWLDDNITHAETSLDTY